MHGNTIIRFLVGVCLLGAVSSQPAGATLETDKCRILGSGAIPDGDTFDGDVTGVEEAFSGGWNHLTPAGGMIAGGAPDLVSCRINGALVATVTGPAAVDGMDGYRYRLSAQDRSDERLVEGTPETQVLVATRGYRPKVIEDDSLEIDRRAIVTIPAALRIVEGGGSNHWATLSFDRHETGDVVTCRYRSDLSGQRMDLAVCTGGRFGGSAVEAGDHVEVTSMTLHVVAAGSDELSAPGARTTVEASVDVTPLVRSDPDRYRIVIVSETESGIELIYEAEGPVIRGDIEVIPL